MKGVIMSEEIYRKLAEYLDRLPGGFAPSTTGADVVLLKRLFTPEEAELALHLTLNREDAQTIAGRAKLNLAEAEQRLSEMAHKGLVFSVQPDTGVALYQAVPFVIGIYEFQVNRLNEGLLQDLDEYWSTQEPRPPAKAIPQMRTIPVGQSIKPQLEVLAYEQVDQLVEAHDRYAVAPCICRRKARMAGEGCDAPEESCLFFGDFADYYLKGGRGRSIDRSEVMEIIARADAANLVLQPSNSKHVAAICCCCGCCCGILAGLKRHPRPADVVASSFIAELEPELCESCWTCLDRCQMEAIKEDGTCVSLDASRCIGCGLCVSTCPSGALTLVRKTNSEHSEPPITMDITWKTIAQAQSEMH
jgi:electron transport complex protein RnfB